MVAVDPPRLHGLDCQVEATDLPIESLGRGLQVHLVPYILSAWKVVQMTQPEFVDSQVYFDALVLKYLS